MNEILQQRIEEAAKKYNARAYSPFDDPYELSKEFERDCYCFKEGANYALSNQWISVEEALPEETKYESDTWQGHKEWTESNRVFVLDSQYGPMIDSTKNGRWRSEVEKVGYQGQIIHIITHWMPIPSLKGGE